MSLDGYTPTSHIRLKADVEYVNDESRRYIFQLQQLWVSAFVGEEPEWREVRLVDSNDKYIDHVTGARLFGRTL